MPKKYTVTDADIQHYLPPELTGPIVGMREDSVRPKTVEEIEEIQKKAYEEAYQEGYKKGFEEGSQKGYEEMQIEVKAFREKATQLESIIRFMNHPLENMDEAVEQQLSNLAVELARHLLKKESSLEAEHIYALVHESLEYLPVRSRNVCVRLHPDDLALLNQAEIDIDNQSWSYVSDNNITPGGCLVESDASHIDASVETRLQQLVEQLDLHESGENTDADE